MAKVISRETRSGKKYSIKEKAIELAMRDNPVCIVCLENYTHIYKNPEILTKTVLLENVKHENITTPLTIVEVPSDYLINEDELFHVFDKNFKYVFIDGSQYVLKDLLRSKNSLIRLFNHISLNTQVIFGD